jgi:hypothetical protein
MAARLTSTGIQFSDNTVLNSKYGIVPQSSVSVFLLSAAPTGWLRSTAQNDKTLRVVGGAGVLGGGSGGSLSFTSAFPSTGKTITVNSIPVSGGVGNHTLTIAQLPSHGHASGGAIGLSPGGGDVGFGGGWTRTFPGWAANGSGGAHSHPWSGSFNFSTTLNFSIQYVNVIICSFV